MPAHRYVVCDVFTDTPLEGNQLAVFTDARDLPEELLQALARELKFSETVFVYPAEAGGHARMRIFTPAAEIPFAGHPTLGTAFVLGAPLQLGEIRLETGMGIVPVTLEREGARIVFGRMSQPIPSVEPFERRGGAPRRARRRALRAADRALRQRAPARLRLSSFARGRGGVAAGHTSGWPRTAPCSA